MRTGFLEIHIERPQISRRSESDDSEVMQTYLIQKIKFL